MAKVMKLVPIEEENQFSQIIEVFPKKYHKQCSEIVSKLKDKINIDGDSNVVYKDGVQGSSLQSLLEFYIGINKDTKPADYSKFARLFHNEEPRWEKW